MSPAKGILYISEDLAAVQDHLKGEWEHIDPRNPQATDELHSLVEPTFFGPAAQNILIHSLDQVGAKVALKLVEFSQAHSQINWAFHISKLSSEKRRKKFEKVLVATCGRKNIKPPTAAALCDECLKQARRLGAQISHACIELLVETLGQDRQLLQKEIEKFSLLGRAVEENDIIQSYSTTHRSAFTIPRSLFHEPKQRVLAAIAQMEPFEDPFLVANAFVHELSRLYMVHLLGPRADFATTGISPYFLRQYQETAHALQNWQLRELMDLAAHTDYTLKTSQVGYDHVFHLVEQICQILHHVDSQPGTKNRNNPTGFYP
ncbi:DNA polymerase III subunit delta [Desulfurispira natronophila]|uniref:DNA polymerase-3 subunit delta n=1 Tax=Desulfurispira natronophila TaxID=682562 RepID=A0A7W7Y4A8_9BACT|nr:hypothetical protein [Desulfurispira natronophila]MBB5021772.1 DNA polymerase-3 subunit delta [Desulfurispira natronophila]